MKLEYEAVFGREEKICVLQNPSGKSPWKAATPRP
jgi:hypothetical protein